MEHDVPSSIEDWPYVFEEEGVTFHILRKPPLWVQKRMDENRRQDGSLLIHDMLTSLYTGCVKTEGEEALPHSNLENVGMDYYQFFKDFFKKFFVQPIQEPHPSVPPEIDGFPYEFEFDGQELRLKEPNPAWIQKEQDRSNSTAEFFKTVHENLIIPVDAPPSDRRDLNSDWDYYSFMNTLLGRFVVGPLA